MAEDKRTPTGSYYSVVSGFAGEAETWKAVVAELRERAGKAYAANQDEEAEVLRDLAKEWEPRSAAARAKQAQYQSEFRPLTEQDKKAT
jgi:LmbE family N-acetylglucosaminyl deacetylase